MDSDKGAAGNLVTRSLEEHFDTIPGSALLYSTPQSADRDFLIRRFFDLYRLNFGLKDGTREELAAKASAQKDRLIYGGVDAINDHYLIDKISLIRAMVAGVEFDHPGRAFFQGQVYTHGYVYASDEVAIIGALVTSIDPGSPPPASKTVGARTIDPGDVVILDGCSFLFVEDFFKPRSVSGPEDPGAKVMLWYVR